jgi:uncharacterized protein (DUF302 family)
MVKLRIQKSPYSVAEATMKLEKAIDAQGMMLFALIEHSAEAESVNMSLRDEKVVIFGDPKVGTLLMQENPKIGIELPLRILVWQDEEGTTQIAYADTLALGESYGIVKNKEILKRINQGMEKLMREVL